MANGCVARDLVPRQGARREYILHGSLTDEQRRRSGKDQATLRAKLWRAAGGIVPQSQSASAMLLRRALPAARQNLAHPFAIYEMGLELGAIVARENQPQIDTDETQIREERVGIVSK
jgi:hypothetical protein